MRLRTEKQDRYVFANAQRRPEIIDEPLRNKPSQEVAMIAVIAAITSAIRSARLDVWCSESQIGSARVAANTQML